MDLMEMDAKSFDSVVNWYKWYHFRGGLGNADDCFECAR
jgi:hypothetical protein